MDKRIWASVSENGKSAAAGMSLGPVLGVKTGGGDKPQSFGPHGWYLGPLHAANTHARTATDAGGRYRRMTPKDHSPVPRQDDGGAAFYKALRFRESSDRTTTKGAGTHLGLYQMGNTELRNIGALDAQGRWTGKYGWSREEFMASPGLQEQAVRAWHGLLWREIRQNHLDRYEGHVLDGVEVTASGMLAGAHLKGVQELGRYLRSGGQNDPHDAFGTTIGEYVKNFSGYPVSLPGRR